MRRRTRLRKLLDHLPEDARLNANLGMIRFLEERADDAMKLASRAFVALIDARTRWRPPGSTNSVN